MYYLPQHYSWIYWLLPFVILDLILKAVALWKSARNSQLYWFIGLIAVNSLGILPLVYLAFFRKKASA